MQAIGSTEVNTGLTPQVRELIRTIVNAATALKRLFPGEELEHGFEFHWGHFYSSQAGEMSVFKPKTRANSGAIPNQAL